MPGNDHWFALQNTKGERLTYIPGDGDITIMRDGAPTKFTFKDPHFKPTEIGSTIKMKVKGKPDIWTVDRASIDEIATAAGIDIPAALMRAAQKRSNYDQDRAQSLFQRPDD
jgi:hypothetical protein